VSRATVAVLMGGRSSEHEVSLASGDSIAGALDPDRYDLLRVVIARDGGWSVDGDRVALVPADGGGTLLCLNGGAPRRVDVVFPALHGPFGEDGTVQGLCETLGVPYVGAGVTASALAMDKALFKTFLRDAGIPTPESVTVEAGPWARDPEAARRAVARELGYPVFVKPARLGSSVGISRVDGPEALGAAIDLALAHDPKALVERCVAGREVEIGVLGNGDDLLASPPGEITYESGWYDYETKYLPDRMRLVVPADLPEEVARGIEELARRAFVAIGCCGMARVDYFVEDGNALVSELNTIPGFTPTSVYAKLFEAGGVSYSELVGRLIELGLEAAAERGRYRA